MGDKPKNSKIKIEGESKLKIEEAEKTFEEDGKIKTPSHEKTEMEEIREIEYISKLPIELENDENFKNVFERFNSNFQQEKSENEKLVKEQKEDFPVETSDKAAQKERKENEESDEEMDKPRLSNKKRKLRDRLTIAQLKQIVDRPDLVELHDPNSPDPTLLVLLKSTRNSVPVPAHWLDKRRYLQGKRGVEKAIFQLPKAIQEIGVSELRNPGRLATLKQKQRQRMNPKLGRLDVDYQKLHAAFFRNMVKPRMTSHGDIYYLGKENEVRYRKHRPGNLSKRLKNALHMMENAPPPYLINMQRFGPPPSYTMLRIPGLNAPIPPGCKYGYGEGQWGKPPVNDSGYPLYGDPFGVNSTYEKEETQTTNAFLWGKIDENVNYEDEFDEEEEEEIGENGSNEVKENDSKLTKNPKTNESELITKETPETNTNITSNLEGDDESSVTYGKTDTAPKQLYKILDKKESSVSEKSAMGSAHTYNIAADERNQQVAGNSTDKVSVALNEEELASLDEMTIKMKYEEVMRRQKAGEESERGDKMLARGVERRKKGKKKDKVVGFKF